MDLNTKTDQLKVENSAQRFSPVGSPATLGFLGGEMTLKINLEPKEPRQVQMPKPGNTKEESITVQLTSYLTGLESSV
jgi:hypothetical protein